MTSRLAFALVVAALVVPAAGADAQSPPAAGSPAGSGPVASTGFATGPAEQVAQPGIGALFGSPFPSEHLFGNWDGARTWLQDRGVDVSLDYLTENGGNITGGRREGFRTSGQVGLELDLDLDKLLGWQGAALHSITVNREGRNVSADLIGDDLATVQEIYGGGGNVVAHLVYAYLEQELLKGRVDLAAGWQPVGTYFASSPLYCDFMNVLFCGNPHPLPNYPTEDDWPQATFGAQARIIAAREFYLQLGAFSVDPDFGTGGGGQSGFAWADSRKSGVSIPVEIGWVPRVGPVPADRPLQAGLRPRHPPLCRRAAQHAGPAAGGRRRRVRQPGSRRRVCSARPDAPAPGQGRHGRPHPLRRLGARDRRRQSRSPSTPSPA